MDTFANRLRFARQQRKLSQTALARACGLSQGAISSYETGERKSAKEIFKLAQVLQVNPSWLSLGSGSMDIHSQTATAPRSVTKLRDINPPASPYWPFQELSEEDYWALTEKQRRMIDHVAAAMVKSMHLD